MLQYKEDCFKVVKYTALLESLLFNTEKYTTYLGGSVAALRALSRGQSVGVVSARSNAGSQKPLLSAIEDQLSLELGKRFTFDAKHVHFVNDSKFTTLFNVPPTAPTYTRKAAVVLSYVLDTNSPYEKVKFYDDDNRNLEAVKSELRKAKELLTSKYLNGLRKLRADRSNVELRSSLRQQKEVLQRFKRVSLKLYDVKEYDNKKLDEEKRKRSEYLFPEKQVLHLFDVDDTLVVLPSEVKVKVGGVVTKSLSTSQLATYTPSTGEELDFSQFTDEDEVRKVVQKVKKLKSNVFKK